MRVLLRTVSRPLLYLWHRIAGERWWRRARTAERQARDAFARNLIYAQRARAHDAEAVALYPPRGAGPPEPLGAAAGEEAPVHQGGP